MENAQPYYTVSYLIEMIAPWKGGQTQPLVNTQIAMLDAKRRIMYRAAITCTNKTIVLVTCLGRFQCS